MGVIVFDMGKNIKACECLQRALDGMPHFEEYVRGRSDQFMLDLLMTGKATMPDGKVATLFQRTKP